MSSRGNTIISSAKGKIKEKTINQLEQETHMSLFLLCKRIEVASLNVR
jgi:hypothetical protein